MPYTPAAMTSEMRRRHLSDVTRLAADVTQRLQTTEAGMEPVRATCGMCWDLVHGVGSYSFGEGVQPLNLSSSAPPPLLRPSTHSHFFFTRMHKSSVVEWK